MIAQVIFWNRFVAVLLKIFFYPLYYIGLSIIFVQLLSLVYAFFSAYIHFKIQRMFTTNHNFLILAKCCISCCRTSKQNRKKNQKWWKILHIILHAFLYFIFDIIFFIFGSFESCYEHGTTTTHRFTWWIEYGYIFYDKIWNGDALVNRRS